MAQAKSKRRKSLAVGLGVTGLLAAGLTGYAVGNDDDQQATADADYGAVCVDSQTQQRVDDDQCDPEGSDRGYGGGGGFVGWYFLPIGGRYPAVGAPISGATRSLPAGASVSRGGLAPSGGTVSRGGFGTSNNTSARSGGSSRSGG